MAGSLTGRDTAIYHRHKCVMQAEVACGHRKFGYRNLDCFAVVFCKLSGHQIQISTTLVELSQLFVIQALG